MENEWTLVVKKQKIIPSSPIFDIKWDRLKSTYPHIVIPARANRLCRNLNIDGLDTKLMSDEWIDYQCQGWCYVKVLKVCDEIPNNTEYTTYSILNIYNKWRDRVLFSRTFKKVCHDNL